jgi:hypothetical protein
MYLEAKSCIRWIFIINLQQDLCLNGEKCILFEKTNKNLLKKLSKKEIVCPCKGKYNFHCGTKYCTINSLVCNHLLATKSIKNMKSIPKCMNHNQTIKITKYY